ncbi:LOW QUALITY PROTEIN: hypothetical protein N665_0747s0006 [Sinapis alba]|nr:LOW QUALITY PROTEIN: hypothetical protein N665_0747s0006 [Sinapis alba]
MDNDGIVLGHKVSAASIEADRAEIEFMTDLICKEVKFDFTPECLKAFEEIKTALVTSPIVQPPDWTLPFEIMCDASDFVVDAVLVQKKKVKKVHDVYYASRNLEDDQRNCATTEKELLAVVCAFESFSLSYWFKSSCSHGPRCIKIFDAEERPKTKTLEMDPTPTRITHRNKDKRGVQNGVAYHLSRIRLEDDIPIDDFIPPPENVYLADLMFIGNMCLRSEHMSTDT